MAKLRAVRFEWSLAKADANKRKHRISFELAQKVFDDEFKSHIGPNDESGEQRWLTIGLVFPLILVVVHTWEENDEEDIIRIISVRRATATERRRYEEG